MFKKKTEWIIAAMVCLVLIALFSSLKVVMWNRAQGDTTLYSQLLRNIITTGYPHTEIGANTLYYIFPVNVSGMTLEEVKTLNLKAPPEDKLLKNFFRFHKYSFLYLLTPFKFINTDVLFPISIISSFFLMLFVGYYWLRGSGVPALTSFLFIFLAASHPAFSISIFGQLYPDRFFLFLAATVAFLCSDLKKRGTLFLVFVILCWLVNERAGLILGVFLLLHYALYFRKDAGIEKVKLFSGIFSLAASVILIKLFMNNAYYASYLITSFHSYVAYLKTPGVVDKIGVFLFFNGIFLAMCVRDWRALIIALVMLFPNLFGNVGGAEKTGWLTHYHTYYLPFVFWAAASGLKKSVNLEKKWVVNFALFFLIMVVCLKNPYTRGFSFGNFNNNFMVAVVKDFKNYFLNGYFRQMLFIKNEFRNSIPPGSRISSVESAWYPFYQTARSISYFPIGLEDADYAVVVSQKEGEKYKYSGFFSYRGPVVEEEINEYLVGKMKEFGYDLESPVYVSPWGHAVIRKKELK